MSVFTGHMNCIKLRCIRFAFLSDAIHMAREHKQNAIQCLNKKIVNFRMLKGGSQFSTGVIFLRVRHVKNGPLWHFFYTWDTFFYGQGVISLRRKMTPRSIFDGGRYSSLFVVTPAWMVRRGVYCMKLDRLSVFLFVYLSVFRLFPHAYILRFGGYTAAKFEL